MSIEDIAKTIRDNSAGSNKRKPILIAIDGYGGSGKSTIAEELRKALSGAYVIGIDDFLIKEKLLDKSADEVLFDRARLEQQILIPVRQRLPIKYQQLKWLENKLSDPIKIPTTSYLIIEGISTCHPDVADYYDYKIWVDAPPAIAKQRGKQRDAGNENEPHWDVWSANDQAYQAKYHPEQQADFVIENG